VNKQVTNLRGQIPPLDDNSSDGIKNFEGQGEDLALLFDLGFTIPPIAEGANSVSSALMITTASSTS
jgi:hypothetical protein